MFGEEKLRAVMDNGRVMNAGQTITRDKMVHDGETIYHRIKNQRSINHVLPFVENVVEDAQGQSHKEHLGVGPSVWSVCRCRAENRIIRCCGS